MDSKKKGSIFDQLRKLGNTIERETSEAKRMVHNKQENNDPDTALNLLKSTHKEVKSLKKEFTEAHYEISKSSASFSKILALAKTVTEKQLKEVGKLENHLQKYGYSPLKVADLDEDCENDDNEDSPNNERNGIGKMPRLADSGISQKTIDALSKMEKHGETNNTYLNSCYGIGEPSTPLGFKHRGIVVTPGLLGVGNDGSPGIKNWKFSQATPRSARQHEKFGDMGVLESPERPVFFTPGMKQIKKLDRVPVAKMDDLDSEDIFKPPQRPVFQSEEATMIFKSLHYSYQKPETLKAEPTVFESHSVEPVLPPPKIVITSEISKPELPDFQSEEATMIFRKPYNNTHSQNFATSVTMDTVTMDANVQKKNSEAVEKLLAKLCPSKPNEDTTTSDISSKPRGISQSHPIKPTNDKYTEGDRDMSSCTSALSKMRFDSYVFEKPERPVFQSEEATIMLGKTFHYSQLSAAACSKPKYVDESTVEPLPVSEPKEDFVAPTPVLQHKYVKPEPLVPACGDPYSFKAPERPVFQSDEATLLFSHGSQTSDQITVKTEPEEPECENKENVPPPVTQNHDVKLISPVLFEEYDGQMDYIKKAVSLEKINYAVSLINELLEDKVEEGLEANFALHELEKELRFGSNGMKLAILLMSINRIRQCKDDVYYVI